MGYDSSSITEIQDQSTGRTARLVNFGMVALSTSRSTCVSSCIRAEAYSPLKKMVGSEEFVPFMQIIKIISVRREALKVDESREVGCGPGISNVNRVGFSDSET